MGKKRYTLLLDEEKEADIIAYLAPYQQKRSLVISLILREYINGHGALLPAEMFLKVYPNGKKRREQKKPDGKSARSRARRIAEETKNQNKEWMETPNKKKEQSSGVMESDLRMDAWDMPVLHDAVAEANKEERSVVPPRRNVSMILKGLEAFSGTE
jgi:hypothetical protein